MEFDATIEVHCNMKEMVFQAWMTTAYMDEDPVQTLLYSGNKIGFAHWFATLVEGAELAENVVTVGLSNYSQ
jgi:hypothetical protein